MVQKYEIRRDVLRHGPTGPGPRTMVSIGVSSRSRLKIMIRIISIVKCYFRLYSPKNWEFRTICQLVTCENLPPCIGQDLPPYTLITHLVKRRQLVEPVCAIVNLAHLFVSSYCLYKYLTTDEAHFWLNGYVNKQNCRLWSEANPQVYVETPLHPEKLTVWGALWAGGILLQKR
ncbi:hypothetical protein TNCV_4367191 [Trichonephila clavipes]|nr:hypothetical protein TNCV_4367191 [Trichonephila clavipes]